MPEGNLSKRYRPGASDAAEEERPSLPGGLYLLATPIGAADDITLRGLDALHRADALACEDSRVLRRLMDLHGIAVGARPIIVYHDHNAEASRPRIVERLAAGDSVVYASDAGTPLIADPGYRLVEAARGVGASVTALPGASALLAALAVAGLPTDRFCFLGFAPPKSAARRAFLEGWAAAPATLVLYEAPHRLAEMLTDAADVLGPRPAAIARELTKRFEEVRRDDLAGLAQSARDNPAKGEIVVVVGPPPKPRPADDDMIDEALLNALQTMSVKEAVRTVTERLHAPRKSVYARAIALKRDDES